MKTRGNVTVNLIRPAIIASSLSDPFPGWTDSLTAAGGISMLTGLGIIHFMHASGRLWFDVVPVDIVSNHILISTAYGPQYPGEMRIYNCATSSTNPISVGDFKDAMIRGYRLEKFNQQAGPIHLEFVEDANKYKIKKTLLDDLPIAIFRKAAELPVIGSPSLVKQLNTL